MHQVVMVKTYCYNLSIMPWTSHLSKNERRKPKTIFHFDLLNGMKNLVLEKNPWMLPSTTAEIICDYTIFSRIRHNPQISQRSHGGAIENAHHWIFQIATAGTVFDWLLFMSWAEFFKDFFLFQDNTKRLCTVATVLPPKESGIWLLKPLTMYHGNVS